MSDRNAAQPKAYEVLSRAIDRTADTVASVADTCETDSPAPPRAIVICSDRHTRDRLCARISGLCDRCMRVDSAAAARMALDVERFDVALVCSELRDGDGVELLADIAREHEVCPILVCEAPTLDCAVGAMRAGASDVVSPETPAIELLDSIRRAARRSRRITSQRERAERLLRVCKKMDRARREVTSQVSSLCEDLTSAYDEMAEQMDRFAIAAEFSTLTRSELDVEGLLRTVLEFVLARVGATNAAIYLPSNSSDYSLGAYINYDRDRESADMLLDHLGGVLAPRMETEHGVLSFRPGEELDDFLGSEGSWLCDCNLVTFACQHEGECLAIVALFRDPSGAYTRDDLRLFEIISALFAAQLGKVIHVHHRHLPRDQWGAFDGPDEEDDGLDLAA